MAILGKRPIPQSNDEEQGQTHPTSSTMAIDHTPYRDDPEAVDVAPPAYHQSTQGTPPTTKRSRPSRRFFAALLISVSLLALFSLLSGHPGSRTDYTQFPGRPAKPPAEEGRPVYQAKWSSPEQVPHHRRHPRKGSAEEAPWYSSVANFSLPYTAETETLFVHAAKSSDETQIFMIVDPSLADKNEVSVGVEAVYHERSVRDALWVGELTQNEGRAQGVAIYGWNERDVASLDDKWAIDVYVYLRLPPMAGQSLLGTSALQLPNIEVKTRSGSLAWNIAKDDPALVPNTVVLENRAGSIAFDYIEAVKSVSLSSYAGGVHGRGKDSEIWADSVEVRARAGSIGGTYRVIDNLDLHAGAGSIRVDVLLPGKQPSSLSSATATGGGAEDSYEQSSPHVTAHSTAGSVHVRYAQQHPSVELHSDVATRAGSTEVQHAADYQGTFHLASGAGSIYKYVDEQIKRSKITVDRKRPAGGLVEGEVWIEREDGWSKKGSSSVVTDAGSVRVNL